MFPDIEQTAGLTRNGISLRPFDGLDVSAKTVEILRAFPDQIGRRTWWIEANDQEVVAAPEALVTCAGRNQDRVSWRHGENFPACATKAHPG